MHFGGFAGKYIKQGFFMDVHPPLAKLLITLAAYLRGFRGHFDFSKIGNEYLEGADEQERVPYVAMRCVGALFGTATAPLAYMTLRRMSLHMSTALLGAMLVVFDNALTTQSRLILLDAPLVFFVALSLYAWVTFAVIDAHAPFSRRWWVYLSLTGASLGAVVSCKWVGLFTIATVGLAVVVQLWARLGDLRCPIPTLLRHVAARALCLLVLPMAVYVSMFAIHFRILDRSGPGDSFMTWAFRRTLKGNEMKDTFARVALGSTVSILHYNTLGGYLHSHNHKYETGSYQQQITLYPFRDNNNDWYIIEAPIGDKEFPKDKDGHAIRPDDEFSRHHANLTWVNDGDEVRLVHKNTEKRLHAHDAHRPPVTEADYQDEVTGYGFPGFGGDWNDNWAFEIHKQEKIPRKVNDKEIIALRTIFRLRHLNGGCYLFSHRVSLPDWGFKQQEVTCNRHPTLPNSLWYIETNTHPLLDEKTSPKINYLLPGFFRKFAELQKTMWTVNKRLTDHHVYESRPTTWPLLRRGINFWTKHHRQVYLIGNPMVWWATTCAVLLYLGVRALLVLRAQRAYTDFAKSGVRFYDERCGFLAVAWLLHYVPFHLMSRQLFLHHYLPALYCAILLLAAVFDCLTQGLRPRIRVNAALALIVIAFLVFLRYSPLTYALRWTNTGCGKAIARKTWDFNCREFPHDIAKFAEYEPVVFDPLGEKQHGSFDRLTSLGNLLWHPSSASPGDISAAKPAHHPVHTTGVMTSDGREPFDAIRHDNTTAAAPASESRSGGGVKPASELDHSQMQQAILQGTSALTQRVANASTTQSATSA